MVGVALGVCDGVEVGLLNVGDWEGVLDGLPLGFDVEGLVEGANDGTLLGSEVVGVVEGLEVGNQVGGVGLGVAQAPLSQSQASFAQALSHVLCGPWVIKGEHPGAQSIVWVNC